MNTLPQTFSVATIMAKPDTLRFLADTYFALTKQPTPAGLAVHLGFSSVPALIAAVSNPKHVRESRDILETALTVLEDHLTQTGLTEKTHPAFTKYIMSARLSVVEPKTQQENTNAIQINILGVSETKTLDDLV